MKILITGPNGFVGNHLVAKLKAENYELILASRNLIGDLNTFNSWDSLLQGVETVIHLAARVHQMNDTAIDPLEEFRKTNVLATKRLAQSAVKNGVKHFIFLSSIKVNGEGKDSDYTSSDDPAPEDEYGLSKLEAEEALEQLYQQNKAMNILVIRPPLIYGPGVKGNLKSLEKLIRLRAPIPFKSLNEKRSFLDVQKLVNFIYSNLSFNEGFKVKILCDNNPLSTPELILRLGESIGIKPILIPFPASLLRSGLKLVGKENMYKKLNTRLTCVCDK